MPAPTTSVLKTVRTTQPQFLGTSHARHTDSTIMTVAVNETGHSTTKVRRPQTNDFVERFNRRALDEFFRERFRKKLYEESVEALQRDLGEWIY